MTAGIPGARPLDRYLEHRRPESAGPARRIVVAGIGTEWRRDDGVGPAVVRRFEMLGAGGAGASCDLVTSIGDPLDLLELWGRADLAVVVDAMRSGLAPGTVSCIDLGADLSGHTNKSHGDLPVKRSAVRRSEVGPAASSTHAIGLRSVLLLGRIVDRAPRRAIVVGVEGRDFDDGVGLSTAVAASVDEAARRVLELVEESLACA